MKARATSSFIIIAIIKNYYGDQHMKREMGGTCSKHGRQEECKILQTCSQRNIFSTYACDHSESLRMEVSLSTLGVPHSESLKIKLCGFSSQTNYINRPTAASSAKLVTTFANRECRVVSATDSHGR
jgi:hypothetical protein